MGIANDGDLGRASRSLPPDAAAPSGASGDYSATEAHHLSLASRILAALPSGGLALVTDAPATAGKPLAQALRRLAGSRNTVTVLSYGSELSTDALACAGSVIALQPAESGAVALLKTVDPAPPLFLFEEIDRFFDWQIEDICTAVRRGAQDRATGVLLAGPGFRTRLEDPVLQGVKATLTACFRFDEIGEDEGIDFLRHQLATRHREDDGRSFAPVVRRGLPALGTLAVIAIVATAALHYRDPPVKDAYPSEPAISMPSPAATPPAAAGNSAPQPASKRALLSGIAERPVISATPGPESAKPHSALATPGVSSADIAALVGRGDSFLRAGDIASARLFYERAADAGNGSAALRLGVTYDPGFAARAGIRGDPARAASWYRRARDLGEAAAADRLKNLAPPPPGGELGSAAGDPR